MKPFLSIDRSGAIVTLTMDDPEPRNALTGNRAAQEFVDACAQIAEDASVHVVVLTARGPVFSSGGNLKHMQSLFDASPSALRQWYRQGIQRLTTALYNLEVPTIAAVNGPAIGAGCDLTCMFDIRIAADTATFAESFTGDALGAAEALACVLVSRVVPADRLMDESMALAARIAANPGTALRLTKRLLREGQHVRLDSLLELSAGLQSIAHKTPQHVEAVTAFVEKRKPVFGPE